MTEHLEGRVSVLAALEAGRRKFEAVLLSKEAPEVEAAAARRGVPVRRVAEPELEGLAHGRSHGGVVALCTPRPMETAEDLERLLDGLKEPPLLLLLEGADDARNLGFTLRSAEAFGAQAVLVRRRAWDFDPVEVGRPSSGAFERLALVPFDDVGLLKRLKERGLKVYGAVAGASREMYGTQMWKPCVAAVGGEKRGLSGAVRELCNSLMSIPTRAGSLSMTQAAAVLLAEAMRQRREAGPVC